MSRLPDTGPSLRRYLERQKRQAIREGNASSYNRSGTSVTAEGVTTVDERIIAGTPGGSRVELDSAGLRKYGADGTTVEVDMTGPTAVFSGVVTGSEVIGGVLKTAVAGPRIEIQPSGYSGLPGGEVSLLSGDIHEALPAAIYNTLPTSGDIYSQVYITSAEFYQKAGGYSGQGFFAMFSTYSSDPVAVPPYTGADILAEQVLLRAMGTPDGYYRPLGSGQMRLIARDSFRFDMTDEFLVPQATGSPVLARRIAIVTSNANKAAFVTAYLTPPALYTTYARTITVSKPLFVWQTDSTAGQELQYTTDGTTWTVIGGGSGGPLFADPGADRIAFWDDSAGAFAPLTASTGLTLTGTNLTVRSATDALTGIVELATSAEAVTGTDTARAVTPAGVKAAVYAAGTSTGVSYSAGWADGGSGTAPVTWYKDKDGYIRLSGLLKRTGATITSAPSGTIFTLPVGARPAGSERFLANKENAVIFPQVGATGVFEDANANTWVSGSAYLYVSGIMFKAA